MTAQRTPDELATENELICTKLLGWGKCEHIAHIPGLFHTPAGKHEEVPSFTTWAEAGLILDAFMAAGANAVPYLRPLSIELVQGLLTPFSIRMAAIEYIGSLP